MPELGHLRAFVAVAEERSFTRGAQRLHLAQQAVSKSVATLEAQLGVSLLLRTTREVTLTAAGQALLTSGTAALAQVDAAFAEATALGTATAGTVRVGVTPAVGSTAHPRIAAALTAGTPKLRVTFHELRPIAAAEALRHRDLDMVISRVRPPDDEFACAALPSTAAIAVVSPTHPLGTRDRIATRELDGATLQMWSGLGDAYTDDVVARFAAAGANVQVRTASVIGGGGPPTLGDDEFAVRPAGWPLAGAVGLELADPGVELPLWVYWPAGNASPTVERLRRHLA